MDNFSIAKCSIPVPEDMRQQRSFTLWNFRGQKVSQEIAIEFKDSDPLEKLMARSRLFEPICS